MSKATYRKALLVYGTRYGATKGTADEIAKVLKEYNFEVKIVNTKEEKVRDVSQYGLIVVGTGMAMGNWASEVEDFVKRMHKDFEGKKLALFISSLKPVEEKEGKTDLVNRIQKVGLDDKILKYQLKPISTIVFGGIVDYTKMNFLIKKGMELGYKAALERHGFRQIEPNVFDLRDCDKIRLWARELAMKALDLERQNI
jgi:menaquinone-dependent protoporphyrinogen IX oxidase